MYSNKNMRKVSNQNSFFIIGFLLITFSLVFVLKIILSKFYDTETEQYEDVYFITGMLVQYLAGAGIPLFVFFKTKTGKEILSERRHFTKPQMPVSWIVRHIFIAFFFIYGTSFLSNILFEIIEMITGIELHAVDFSANDNNFSRFGNIVAMMFLAPFFEELMFRGTLLRNGGKYGTWSMIIMNGIMFGLWHMNYAQILFAMVFGIYGGFLSVKTKSIIPSMILHFIMNTIGAFQSLFIGNIDMEKLDNNDFSYIMSSLGNIIPVLFSSLLVVCLIITGFVLFIIEIVNHKDSYKLEKVCGDVSEAKKLGVYFTAPLTILLVIGMIAVSVINALFG